MDSISIVPAQIASWLQEQEVLEGIVFIPEYPAIKKAVPLQQAIVAVGLENVSITDSFVENDEGVLEKQEYCRSAKLRLRLSIHAPYSFGGEYCHSVFTKVADCLTFGSGMEITQSEAGRIISDRDTDAFVLECYLDVMADFCPAENTELTYPSFMNKELLCGSHIANNNIHFASVAEKQKMLQPFVTGSYTGTGSNSRSVSFGFSPSMVIVFAEGSPIVGSVPSLSNQGCYYSIAFKSDSIVKASLGLAITSSGFQVTNRESEVVRGTVSRLNESGLSYSWIAWR